MVVVVEHQDPVLAARAGVVQRRRHQHHGRGRAVGRVLGQRSLHAQGRADVGPEADGVVVVIVERHPGGRPRGARGDPLRQQGGLPEPGGAETTVSGSALAASSRARSRGRRTRSGSRRGGVSFERRTVVPTAVSGAIRRPRVAGAAGRSSAFTPIRTIQLRRGARRIVEEHDIPVAGNPHRMLWKPAERGSRPRPAGRSSPRDGRDGRQACSEKACRRAASSSSERFVWISSGCCGPRSASRTLSRTAPEVIRNSAEVPGVTWSRTFLMKSSSMPTSVSEPVSAPVAAPTASPSSGTKKISPNRRPQKAPPRAPAPVRLFSSFVFGFFLSGGQLDDRRVVDLDQLFLLQLLQYAQRLLGALRRPVLPDRQGRGHRASSSRIVDAPDRMRRRPARHRLIPPLTRVMRPGGPLRPTPPVDARPVSTGAETEAARGGFGGWIRAHRRGIAYGLVALACLLTLVVSMSVWVNSSCSTPMSGLTRASRCCRTTTSATRSRCGWLTRPTARATSRPASRTASPRGSRAWPRRSPAHCAPRRLTPPTRSWSARRSRSSGRRRTASPTPAWSRYSRATRAAP